MTVRDKLPRVSAAALLALALAALSSCGGSALTLPDDGEWARAVDAVSQVGVDLPGEPEMQTRDVPLPTGEEVAARLWIVELGDYGAASMMIADSNGMPIDLGGALAGAAANIGARVVEQSPAAQDGRAAIDGTFEFDRDGLERRVHLRIVDIGGSMVMLQSTARAEDGDALRQLHQRMLDSVVVPR